MSGIASVSVIGGGLTGSGIAQVCAQAGLSTTLCDMTPEPTILASNTSALVIAELAVATTRADRVCGLHFFNPVPLMRLGCGHPMGPFTLLDFVGLDTVARIAEIMFEEYREARYASPPLLKRMVTAGWYGRKSGRGFYDYSAATPVVNSALG